jgi:hypothetical protein
MRQSLIGRVLVGEPQFERLGTPGEIEIIAVLHARVLHQRFQQDFSWTVGLEIQIERRFVPDEPGTVLQTQVIGRIAGSGPENVQSGEIGEVRVCCKQSIEVPSGHLEKKAAVADKQPSRDVLIE